jgi:superfamily II DNA or RNA helicase
MHCGKRALLVAPTGAGKTIMGAMAVLLEPGTTLWVVHTQDLVEQSAAKLRAAGLRVGIIAAGHPADPFARVQVASIQTLLARDLSLKTYDLVILDEAHHYLADAWRATWEKAHAKRLLGLTATPERGDGRPLGDIFDELVVAAHYSELTRDGYLVPLRILRPVRELDKGVARKPLDAYQRHGEGRSGFVYLKSVEEARSFADDACAAGISSACVDFKTPASVRSSRLAAFDSMAIRLLSNQNVLTEGVDIPHASVCVIGRVFGHVSMLMQSAGRVLRPHQSKTEALLLDLPGLTHREGWLPTEDKEYSLHGRGIKKSASAPGLHVCMQCGACYESSVGKCPRCGDEPEKRKPKPQRIYNEELRPVLDGANTPEWAKKAELERLRGVAREKKLGVNWVVREYASLFNEKPPGSNIADAAEQRAEYDRLMRQAKEKGYAAGWAAHRYQALFGAFPPRSWKMQQEQADVV